ncbi:Dabb family protein [Nakamurella antarctica]|uniref:Dabb family protein n=1 Tax=Nakamurella antarctica TaxID=1902245 RepID=A0A3G8ZIG0_9ACTN|nr:Dabb family protein [Nakamurella antarctica]AZI57159.1 Dabb family protein [Nakamurella antarctica]
MIRHILLAQVPTESEKAMLQSFDDLRAVVDRLPGATGLAFGPSRSPEALERGFTHGLCIDFVDHDALKLYADDAEHRAIGQRIVGCALGGVDGLVVVDLELH